MVARLDSGVYGGVEPNPLNPQISRCHRDVAEVSAVAPSKLKRACC